jgi:hypothetical protein
VKVVTTSAAEEVASMGCCSGLSRCILLVSNTLVFLLGAGACAVSIYVFRDEVGKSLTRQNMLVVVGSASVIVMLFSLLGCRAAFSPPAKRCSRCIYLTLLLVLFFVEFITAGLIFNMRNSLEVAKEHNFDITKSANKAAATSMHLLYLSLHDYYVHQGCHGGGANSTTIPIGFSKITCNGKGVNEAVAVIFANPEVVSETQLKGYETCRQNPDYTKEKPTEFTEAFCGSQENIASLAQKYEGYIMWFPIALAALTLLLLICMICVIADQRKRRRQELSDAREPFRRVQMAA